MKNKDLYNATESLRVIAKTKIKGVTSFAIALNLKNIDAHIELVEAERKKMVDKYTKKDKDGNAVKPVDKDGKVVEGQVLLAEETLEDFKKEAEALAELDITDVLKIKPIKIDELKDIELEPSVLVPILGWLVVE